MIEMLNRQQIPALGKPDRLNLKEPDCLTLENGVELFVINAGNEPVTRIDLVLQAGSVHQHKKLVSGSVGSLLKEGTSSLTALQIAEELDYHGAYFDVNASKDTTTVTLFSLTRHLTKLVPLLSAIFNDAVFPEDELRIYLTRRKQEFLVNIEKVRFKASLEFNKLVFGKNTAYGQVLEESDFDLLERSDLLDFYNARYIPENTYIILSGKVDDSVTAMIEEHFGRGWSKGSGVKPPRLSYASVDPLKEQFVKKKGSMQSAIQVGRQIVSKLHPDYNRFVLLNTILGGYFGSRLMSNLREDKGYTYGVNSFVANYVHGGYFAVATQVNAGHTQAALDEIFKEVRLLREKEVSDEELSLVKNYIYGTFLRNFDGPFALAERFRAVRDFGLGFDFYRKSLDEILSTDARQLLETANKYLQAEDLYRLVVGEMGG